MARHFCKFDSAGMPIPFVMAGLDPAIQSRKLCAHEGGIFDSARVFAHAQAAQANEISK